MAVPHAKDAYLSVDGTDVTAYTDTMDLDIRQETAETTPFGVTDKTYIAGNEDGTFNAGGSWDPTGDAALIGTFDGAVVSNIVGPEGNGSGDVQYTANYLPTSYRISVSSGGRVNWSTSFQRSGDITRGTV